MSVDSRASHAVRNWSIGLQGVTPLVLRSWMTQAQDARRSRIALPVTCSWATETGAKEQVESRDYYALAALGALSPGAPVPRASAPSLAS